MQHEISMKNIIKLFLSILTVVFLVVLIQEIKLSDTNTIDLDYYIEEETALLYLYYINKVN